MPGLRSPRVKGPLHDELRAWLKHATATGVCTQESLAGAIGKTQTGVGKYLLDKAGSLDLDEADAALRHANHSLPAFLAKQPAPQPAAHERLASRLQGREDVMELLEALLSVPRKRLPAVRDLIGAGVYAATGRPLGHRDESGSGSGPEGRTTREPKPRRSVPRGTKRSG